MALISLRDLMPATTERIGSSSQSTFIHIKRSWPKIITSLSIETAIQPKMFSKGVLFLGSKNPSDIENIRLRMDTVKSVINNNLPPGKKINKISF